jgi:hypothetical protein
MNKYCKIARKMHAYLYSFIHLLLHIKNYEYDDVVLKHLLLLFFFDILFDINVCIIFTPNEVLQYYK